MGGYCQFQAPADTLVKKKKKWMQKQQYYGVAWLNSQQCSILYGISEGMALNGKDKEK